MHLCRRLYPSWTTTGFISRRSLSSHPLVHDGGWFTDDETTSPAWEANVGAARAILDEEGILLLQDFLSKDGLRSLAAEARAVASRAHVSQSTHDFFLRSPEAVDKSGGVMFDPASFGRTDVGSVATDHLPDGSHLLSLYQWPPLLRFISEVTGQTLHRIRDPLGACTLNVFRKGMAHHWHFDESPVTVTIMLQTPSSGGAFEVIKDARAEANFRRVYFDEDLKTIGAAAEGVVTPLEELFARATSLDFPAGTLSIFRGRQSLHRVSPVQGQEDRLVAVLCFSEEEGFVNTEETRRRFWGRSE